MILLRISLVGLVASLIAGGCSTAKRVERSETSSAADEWERYEAEFQPSEHDPDLKLIFADLRKEKTDKRTGEEISTEPDAATVVPGFRIQLLATPDIDEVNAQRAAAESIFIGERFYIVYDSPTYKLRVGNFLSRVEAESFVLRVQASGYPDAWVVPDRVLKNPSQR